jgi:hypothetical protein
MEITKRQQAQRVVKCEICKRKLTDPTSIARRIGPECAARAAVFAVTLAADVASFGLTETSTSRADVQRWLELAERALWRGHTRDYRNFMTAAWRTAQQTPLAAQPVLPVPSAGQSAGGRAGQALATGLNQVRTVRLVGVQPKSQSPRHSCTLCFKPLRNTALTAHTKCALDQAGWEGRW